MKGQSLFEVIFAIAIAALILVGVVTVAANSVRNASFARNQALATRHVQGASEWLRAERDAGWTAFSLKASAGGTVWCLSSLSWPGFPVSCGPVIGGTIFTREAKLVLTTPDIVEATITVEWTDTQGFHEAQSVARFTNWRSGGISTCFFNNPQPPGSTSALCQPDPPGGSPSSSCSGPCCRYTCDGGITHWCETSGPPGACDGFMDCGLEC